MAVDSIAVLEEKSNGVYWLAQQFLQSDKVWEIAAGVILQEGSPEALKVLESCGFDRGLLVPGTFCLSFHDLASFYGCEEKYLVGCFERNGFKCPYEFLKLLNQSSVAKLWGCEEMGGPVDIERDDRRGYTSARFALAVAMFMKGGRNIPRNSKVREVYDACMEGYYGEVARYGYPKNAVEKRGIHIDSTGCVSFDGDMLEHLVAMVANEIAKQVCEQVKVPMRVSPVARAKTPA